MKNNIELIGKKSSLLQHFLDATINIKNSWGIDDEQKRIAKIQQSVQQRDSIIAEINIINPKIAAASSGDKAFDAELEKHTWLWIKLLEQVKEHEDFNSIKIEELMNGYMDKVKSTKESIKVLDAYAKQMGDDSSINIDKKQ